MRLTCILSARKLPSINRFLRDIGKHFRVNEMIKAEGYRHRLERELNRDDQWGKNLADVEISSVEWKANVFTQSLFRCLLWQAVQFGSMPNARHPLNSINIGLTCATVMSSGS